MNKKMGAFSLIEVIIAASILSVTVFGVYKLIGENSKLINNSGNYIQLNSLMPSLQECINSKTILSITTSVGNISYFDFGTNLQECNIGTNKDAATIIDNIAYYMQGEIVEKESDYIKWELTISADSVGEVESDFYQKD